MWNLNEFSKRLDWKVGVENDIKALREDEWELKKDLVLREGKVYIPKNNKLRLEVIWLHYDVPVVEHGKKWKITKLATRNYW